jgi:O-antigen/teichoic acid export membrane protein
VLFAYVARYHGFSRPLARRESVAAQLKQAAPFALSGALHGIRNQGDQWIAAAVFSVAMFASFSIATVLAPLVQIFRQSVNNVFLPSMSRLESAGEVAAMLRLNNRANIMVALLVYPILAFAFVFAEQVISLVYTNAYLDAAPVLRLYVVGLLASVVELVSILFVLRQGSFAAAVNAIVLCIALPISWLGATHWGLAGAALGSITALYVERIVTLHRIARLAQIPVRRLQDWGALLGVLAAAAVSAAVAGVALRSSTWSPLATLAVGGLVLAAIYPAALFVSGQARWVADFYASLRAVRA